MAVAIPYSLCFPDGRRVFLHGRKQLLLGRGGEKIIKIAKSTSGLSEEKLLAELTQATSINAEQRFLIMEKAGREVKVEIAPDVKLLMYPNEGDFIEQSNRISARHLLLKWEKDMAMMQDAGSLCGSWERPKNRKIKGPEAVKNGQLISIASVLNLRFKLVYNEKKRIKAVVIERKNNLQTHSYIFFRDVLTFGPGAKCDIRFDAKGPEVWGKIDVWENRIGLERVEGAPKLTIRTDKGEKEVGGDDFLVFTLGSTLSWEGGFEVQVKDNEPYVERKLPAEPIVIKPKIDPKQIKERLKEAASSSYDKGQPAELIELIVKYPIRWVVEEGLETLTKTFKKKGIKIEGNKEVFESYIRDVEYKICENSEGDIRELAEKCLEAMKIYLRRMIGPKLVVFLQSDAPIIQGDIFTPDIEIANVGAMEARNVYLTLSGSHCEVEDDDLYEMMCYKIEPKEIIKSSKQMDLRFDCAGRKVKVEALLTFKDEVDDEVQEVKEELRVRVDRPGEAHGGPIEIVFNGDVVAPGATQLKDGVIVRESTIASGKRGGEKISLRKEGEAGGGGVEIKDGVIVKGSKIVGEGDEGETEG